jgi:hypothetical protein
MATCHVGCKLQNGLIMELITPGLMSQPTPAGKRVVIKGANSMLERPRDTPLIGKFAFTEVDEAFAVEWFERNKDMDFVKNGMVFMQKNVASANAEAKEKANILTGLEPLNPDKEARLPHGVSPDKEAGILAKRGRGT